MASTTRVAAILAADVAGYARLIEADEDGTHERLWAYLRDLVDPKIEVYRGRILKSTGDSLLAEFPSRLPAVRCAVEIQREMIERNAAVPVERRIEFRIGIHLGIIVLEDGEVFGEGIRVVDRLVALADPSGIQISDNVARMGSPTFRPISSMPVSFV